ncbi:hypothetical protein ACFQ2B_31070 [Streptomyces stramineus]
MFPARGTVQRFGAAEEILQRRVPQSLYKGNAAGPSPEAERHDAYVRQIVEELALRVDRIRNLAHADRTDLTGSASLRTLSLALLQSSAEMAKDLQDLDAAVVQQARDRGVKVGDIAKSRNISADKVSRDWPADSIDRRMHQRQQRPARPGRAPVTAAAAR